VLGNHGLIVAADDFDGAEALLDDVERRLDLPVRPSPGPRFDRVPDGYRAAHDPEVHGLAMDPFSFKIAEMGTLYPDQCVYLGDKVRVEEGRGVFVADDLNRAGEEVLSGWSRVVQRIDPAYPIQALGEADVSRLLNWDAEKYRIALSKRVN
jgi:rhamnose utilization protein RhaD (predicted bifunctional aldolase and dehydrogenase)